MSDQAQCQRCGRYDGMQLINQFKESPFGGRDVYEFLCLAVVQGQTCGRRTAFMDDAQELNTGPLVPTPFNPNTDRIQVERVDGLSADDWRRRIMGE